MEITKTQFAKLVLGYLKIEKCHIAYNTFLSTSPYLKDYVNPTKRRHLVTRVLGLSLHDILEQFSKIYTIVQEHLEDTEYFNESNHSHLLHDQLLYLLEINVPADQSTPRSSTSIDNVQVTSEDDYPASKAPNDVSGQEKSDSDKLDESKDNNAHIAIQAITDTLLKHPEFQQRIAENINKVRLSDGVMVSPEKLQSKLDDIDNAIKEVLEKTQNDPMFEKLMGEIIGSVADGEMDFNDIPPELEANVIESEMQRKSIDEHNNAAVDSIVTASQSGAEAKGNGSMEQPSKSTEPPIKAVANSIETKTDLNKKLSVNTNSGDIIFYDGTIDNYIQQDNRAVTAPVQSLMLNTSNLLLMTSTPADASVDATKPFYLVNGSPYVNVAPPPQQYFVTNKMLTEKDILTMPTVILTEDNAAKPISPAKPPPKPKKSDGLSEYLTFSNKITEQGQKAKALIHIEIVDESNRNEVMVEEEAPAPAPAKQDETVPDEATRKSQSLEKPTSDSTKQTPENRSRKRSVSTPRSSNKSHVRALDFKFQTPSKGGVVEVRKASPKISTAKSLFRSTSPRKQLDSKKPAKVCWDTDLRATILEANKVSTNVKKKKKPPLKPRKDQANLNKTEEDALKIENNLMRESGPPPKKDAERTAQQKQTKSKKSRKPTGKSNVTVQIIESEDQVHEIALRNFNAKPRFHRKCNIENNTKFKPVADKEGQAVSVEAHVDVDSNSLPVLSIPENSSFATPEAVKAIQDVGAISANRNIMSMLETPYKEGVCPKTPGRSPASTMETPFTKVFNEQMEGVDICSIQTPQLTPFPITPFIQGETPYTNRPTDYSTSSSYYQPSDTEQNKSLEMQILEECKRLESKKTPVHQEEPEQPSDETTTSKAGQPTEEAAHKAIAEKMKSLSSNVIGRKNLNLVKKERKEVVKEENDSSTYESDSNSSQSSPSSAESYVNRTVLDAPDEARYSLRSKQHHEDIRSIIAQVDVKAELKHEPPTKSKSHDQIYKEMEEKRRRTIAKFKNETTPSMAKGDSKARKPQPIPKAPANATPKRTLRSTAQKKPTNKDKLADLQPMQLVETEMQSASDSSGDDAEPPAKETRSEKDAEKLVTGLKQWGIHLVHNKHMKGGNGDKTEPATHSSDSNDENRTDAPNVKGKLDPQKHKDQMFAYLFDDAADKPKPTVNKASAIEADGKGRSKKKAKKSQPTKVNGRRDNNAKAPANDQSKKEGKTKAAASSKSAATSKIKSKAAKREQIKPPRRKTNEQVVNVIEDASNREADTEEPNKLTESKSSRDDKTEGCEEKIGEVEEAKPITRDEKLDKKVVVSLEKLPKAQAENATPEDCEFDCLLIGQRFNFKYEDKEPPDLPDVQLPLDSSQDVCLTVYVDDRDVSVRLSKTTVLDFWRVDPKPSAPLPRKRKRNMIEILDDVSLAPAKRPAPESSKAAPETLEADQAAPDSDRKCSKKKIEDVIKDLKKPKTDYCQELLKEVDVDNFLDKLHGA